MADRSMGMQAGFYAGFAGSPRAWSAGAGGSACACKVRTALYRRDARRLTACLARSMVTT